VNNHLQPPSVLLMGPSGSGKTYSISTLLEAGLDVFVISTEPHGLETLLDAVETKKLPLSKLHWKYVGPSRPGFGSLLKQGNLIANSNQKTLSDQAPTNRDNSGWVKLLTSMCDFIDDKDGQSYGDVTKFGADRALVIDSLSGLSAMAMDVTIGDKVTAGPGEWGIAMRALDKFILCCTSDLACFFIMTAHIEKEEDLITGMSRIMVSTLGKKLAPQMPKFFSEVVLADSEAKGDVRDHYWSTNAPNHVLKNRSLPLAAKLQPSFGPIVAAYKARVTAIQPTAKAS
jgi:hypothetical protein